MATPVPTEGSSWISRRWSSRRGRFVATSGLFLRESPWPLVRRVTWYARGPSGDARLRRCRRLFRGLGACDAVGRWITSHRCRTVVGALLLVLVGSGLFAGVGDA